MEIAMVGAVRPDSIEEMISFLDYISTKTPQT